MLLRLLVALGFGLLAGAVPLRASAEGVEPLSITSSSGSHAWLVEVMRTPADRERGLMFRRHLPQDRGMLFDFGTTEPVMMWMQNTYLPLDMVFIKADGRVLSVAENAEPMSERIIASGGPVLGVLELNAGTVAKLGIRPGDKVVHAMFPP